MTASDNHTDNLKTDLQDQNDYVVVKPNAREALFDYIERWHSFDHSLKVYRRNKEEDKDEKVA